MYVDFLIQTWERVWIPEEMETEVVEKVKSGEITQSSEIFDLHQQYEGIAELSLSQLIDTERTVSVEENKGWATIEIFDGEEEAVFRNGKSYFGEKT
jgi:hypothetical protein